MTTVDTLTAINSLGATGPTGQPTPSKPSTVDILTTVEKVKTTSRFAAKASTVDKLATVDSPRSRPGPHAVIVAGPCFGRRWRACRQATLVQHGHTAGEHLVYEALWKLAGRAPDQREEFRDLAIGYEIAGQVGGSKRKVQRLMGSLQRKLAIEIIRDEISDLPGLRSRYQPDRAAQHQVPAVQRAWSICAPLMPELPAWGGEGQLQLAASRSRKSSSAWTPSLSCAGGGTRRPDGEIALLLEIANLAWIPADQPGPATIEELYGRRKGPLQARHS